jgi:outer membrane protein TolC
MFSKRKGILILFDAVITIASFSQEKNLQYFIDEGLRNSPLLKDFYYQAQSNEINSLQLSASHKVQVNGLSSNSYAPVIGGVGYDAAISNIGNFSEVVQVSRQLTGRKNLQNQLSAIKLLTDSLHIAGRLTEQDLKRTIIAQYITAYGSSQQYSFNKEVNILLSKEDAVLKKLTQAAVYRQTDYLTFLVTLKNQHLSVTQSRNQFQQDYATLNYLCGLVDTSLSTLAAPPLEMNPLPELENTVYYEKLRLDSLLLQNADAQIDYNYKPKLSLYADAGFVSSLQYQPYKNFGTSFGLNLNVPLYDGRQRKMQHNKIEIAERSRQSYRDFYASQYTQQIAMLMQQLNSIQELIDETSDQLKYAEALVKANSKLMTTGDVHIADYVIAIDNYLIAKNLITQNMISKFQVITQINYWSTR